jgi:outer membrane protein OmpA-like peptidoglycan-associated protein
MRLSVYLVVTPLFASALLASGCGSSEGFGLTAGDSRALSALTPSSPAPGQLIESRKVTFAGRSNSAAGTSIAVTAIDGKLAAHSCTGTVASNQTWSCTQQLDDGGYTWTAVAGGISSAGINFVVRTRGVAAPTIDQSASPTKDAFPVLTGTSKGGDGDDDDDDDHHDAVTIVVRDTGGAVVCTVNDVSANTWSCRVPAKLADGTHVLTATASCEGATSPLSNADVVVVKTSIGTPTIDQIVSPSAVNRPVFTGTGESAATVSVSEPSSSAGAQSGTSLTSQSATLLCQASVNAAGKWTCTAPTLADGTHTVSAQQQDSIGNVSASVSMTFAIDTSVSPPPTTTPPAPTIDSPADGAEVEEMRPTITGHTSSGTSVQVTLDGVTYTAQLAPGGQQWSVVPSAPLAVGAHDVTATATDSSQHVSAPASSSFVTVDTGVARGGCTSGGAAWPLLVVVAFLAAIPRRRARALAAVAALALPAASRAQTANTDISLFRPASGGDGYSSVEGARPPLPGEQRFEFRTWTDYAWRPLVFQHQSGGETTLVQNRTGGWFGLQAHLLGPLSVAAQIPVTYAQHGDLSSLPPSSRGPSSLLAGVGDLRITPRLALLRQEWAGIDLATQVSIEFPTARASTLTDDGRVRGEALVAIGRRLIEADRGSLDLLGNAFFRLRPPHELLDVKTGNEAGLRAGLGYLPAPSRAYIPRRLYLELEARTFLRAGFADGSSPAEWRAGSTFCPVRGLAIDLAGGTAIGDGVGAPRARFMAGIGWSPSACNDANAMLRPLTRPVPLPVQVFSEALACPPVAEPPKVARASFVPPAPPDRDGDGIPDADDSCPDEPGPAENHGCPTGTKQLVIVSANKVEILEQVRFATNKAIISAQSHHLLDQVASVLLSHPDLLLVQVEGHTDNTGSPLHNIVLSQKRSEAVAAYLESKGVPAARLKAVGFGQGRPIATNTNPGGRAANRRVAFAVLRTRSLVIEAARPPDS